MNKKTILIQTLTVIIFLASCAKIEPDAFLSSLENNVVVENINEVSYDNNVYINDVLGIVERDFPDTKGFEKPRYDLTSYVGKESDTLMYILNFKDGSGWKIYSSDKRTPAILAEGDSGYFSLEDGSPAVAMWLSCVADDMVRVHRASDSELRFSEEEIRFNRAFWTADKCVKVDRQISRESPQRNDPPGHWEEEITAQTVVLESIDHMVAEWDQWAPYNRCSPYYVNDFDTRACAGCVAIAGSQMLFYLHGKIGLPTTMYSQGYCIGDLDDFQKYFNYENTTVWSSMSTNYNTNSLDFIPEAVLIGYVGELVEMNYCEVGSNRFSWTLPGKLKTKVFEPYGISCSQGMYNENSVKSSLLNQMPVIVTATNLLVPLDFDIHCFVIDGYRKTQIKYTHYHHYVYDVDPEEETPAPDEFYTYTYSVPDVTGIKINWGWWSQWTNGANDGWYTLTGDWVVTNADGETYDYNYHRNMIYDFAVAQ
jgi:hypothetical protein